VPSELSSMRGQRHRLESCSWAVLLRTNQPVRHSPWQLNTACSSFRLISLLKEYLVVGKLMIGVTAAVLVSMAPMIVSASASTTKTAQSKETAKNHVWGTFKYKAAKRKTGTYGSSKGMPE
jgi:hypothetical protein